MDILRNLFGNFTTGLIRLAVTVGTLAAIYFFAIRPILDTTENVSSSVNESIQRSLEQSGIENLGETIDDAIQSADLDQAQIRRTTQFITRHPELAEELADCLQDAGTNTVFINACFREVGPRRGR